MSFEIRFLGAASTVTGSKYLVTSNEKNILVDCGLFQGLKSLRLKNWEAFPIHPSKIDAILLTHAHIDHSGYIPRLVKEGFRGKIYCTSATKKLAKILLLDSGHLLEEEAEYLNRHRKSKHNPALPLFTQKDAEKSFSLFETIPFEQEQDVGATFSFHFRYAGHILGASSVILKAGGKKIAFTGDIGRMRDKIFFPPTLLPPVDFLITESTYGNRLHPIIDSSTILADAINEIVRRKGVLLVPAFAVGRVQSLLFELSTLRKQNKIPYLPIYLNSPMAADVSQIFWEYNTLHRLTDIECNESGKVIQYIRDVEESKLLNEKQGPMMIIAGSGMLTGGRILHHLKAFAPDSNNMILLTGYQAPGTRGEALINHAPEIKIHGEYVKVAAEIRIINSLSAHADYSEIIEWLTKCQIHPAKVFVTHGEPSSADELRRRIHEVLGWNCVVPQSDEIFKFD